MAPDPAGGRVVVRAVVGLVAERPDDHRGVVLVAQHHSRHAVHERVQIARVVRDLVRVVVRLDVRLVDDVETQLVGEVVERRVVRVVRGADRVEAEPLEQHQVRAHVVVRHRAAGQWMEVVPVDAPDVHALAVDEQVPADDLDVPEADAPVRRVGDRPVGAVQPDGEAVELGCLGVPGAHLGDGGAHAGLAEEVGDAVVLGVEPVELLVLGEELTVEIAGDVPSVGQRAASVPHLAVDPQGAVVGRPHGHVREVQRIGRVQQHRPGDTAVPPLVLVLKVRGVRPLHHGQPYGGPPAGAYDVREVEVGGEVGVLGDADGPPVHVHQQHALGGPDLEHDPPPGPVGRDVHRTLVDPRRIVDRRQRRELCIRHTDVRVLRTVVRVLHGPCTRHVRRRPGLRERRVRRGQQLEAPVAVEGDGPRPAVDGGHGQPPPGGHLG